MKKKYFGTDGIRGFVGGDVMMPDLVLKLGWAAGMVLNQHYGKAKVIIGKDTRYSGHLLEAVLEAGLSSAGVDVWMLGSMPTPGVAYLTRTFRAEAGIVISASHNPYHDNGIKFFSDAGTKFPKELEDAIEEKVHEKMTLVSAAELGKVKRINDAAGRYIEFCKSTVQNFKLKGLKVVVDCAEGATYCVAPNVFRELGADVIVTADNPDGFNINLNCGSTHPEKLAELVLQNGADLGIALDGDGDRVIMVDHTGRIVDGDEILLILALHAVAEGSLQGGVVGTVLSNFGLEEALKSHNIPFMRAQVGDRHVIEMLGEHRWFLGGEPSGHIVCLDLTTTGDGIISALQVLKAMITEGKSLHDLGKNFKRYPQKLVNIPCTGINPRNFLMQRTDLTDKIAELGATLGDCGRVLLRPSGTEPMLRIMVEGDNLAKVEMVETEIVELLTAALPKTEENLES